MGHPPLFDLGGKAEGKSNDWMAFVVPTLAELHGKDGAPAEDDPLIRSFGSGKDIWADEHADEYVSRLRNEESE